LSFIDALAIIGEYTINGAPVAGHEDYFGNTSDGAILENKIVIPFGNVDPKVHLSTYLSRGWVPPGALAYSQFKIATTICLPEDIELHCLFHEMHISSQFVHPDNPTMTLSETRGCWSRTKNKNGFAFYPDGIAVLDWYSQISGNQ
jgi:hypothetical protein